MASTEAFNSVDRAKREGGPVGDGKDGANTRVRNLPHSHTATARKWGLIGGLVIGVIQVLVHYGDQSARPAIGPSLYVIFAITPFLYLALREHRSRLAQGEVFKNGAILGFLVSAIAGTLMGTMVLIASLAGMGPNFANMSVLSFMLVLMTIVYGSAITFVLLQGMKSDAPADENIEKVEGHA